VGDTPLEPGARVLYAMTARGGGFAFVLGATVVDDKGDRVVIDVGSALGRGARRIVARHRLLKAPEQDCSANRTDGEIVRQGER
jgi:hypothetical protein